MDKLFQIGEVAKMFHVSIGSLRHYEKLGILSPEYINEQTGYRYYGVSQFEALNTIRYLRELDMPLTEIAEFLRNRDIDIIETKLSEHKKAVAEKIHRLELIERKIDNRLNKLEYALNCEMDKIRIEKTEERRIVRINDRVSPITHLDLEGSIRKLENRQRETLAFLGKVGVGISREKLEKSEFGEYDFVFLLLDEEDEFCGTVETVPEGLYAVICFRGSHNAAAGRYRALTEYIEENKLKIKGASEEVTIIDYGLTNDTDKFVTEIRIPVEG